MQADEQLAAVDLTESDAASAGTADALADAGAEAANTLDAETLSEAADAHALGSADPAQAATSTDAVASSSAEPVHASSGSGSTDKTGDMNLAMRQRSMHMMVGEARLVKVVHIASDAGCERYPVVFADALSPSLHNNALSAAAALENVGTYLEGTAVAVQAHFAIVEFRLHSTRVAAAFPEQSEVLCSALLSAQNTTWGGTMPPSLQVQDKVRAKLSKFGG